MWAEGKNSFMCCMILVKCQRNPEISFIRIGL